MEEKTEYQKCVQECYSILLKSISENQTLNLNGWGSAAWSILINLYFNGSVPISEFTTHAQEAIKHYSENFENRNEMKSVTPP
jgi:hypothetical protein